MTLRRYRSSRWHSQGRVVATVAKKGRFKCPFSVEDIARHAQTRLAFGIALAFICICSARDFPMLRIPRRYTHFVFGVIQSGLTSLIAAGIASFPSLARGSFLQNWMLSWLIAWVTMLPVVLLAAPAIRTLALALTREE
jgi:hypothetical protein